MSVLTRKLKQDGAYMTKAEKEELKKEEAINGEILGPREQKKLARKSRKGARQRVSMEFVALYEEKLQKYGPDVFDHLARNEPMNFAKIGLGLIPKEYEMTVNKLDELSQEQIDERLKLAFQKAFSLGILGDAGNAGSSDPAEATEQDRPALPGNGTTKT